MGLLEEIYEAIHRYPIEDNLKLSIEDWEPAVGDTLSDTPEPATFMVQVWNKGVLDRKNLKLRLEDSHRRTADGANVLFFGSLEHKEAAQSQGHARLPPTPNEKGVDKLPPHRTSEQA